MPNMATNLLSFGLSVMIGVWFTPYLIRHLGLEAYGLIPLVMTITSYLGLATLTLNGAVGRFMTIALERKDAKEANEIFNTALFGNILIIGLLFVPAVLASWQASKFLNVPTGSETALAWLFFCIICSFFLTTLNSSFSLSSFCRNRFDLSNAVGILSNLVRVGTVVALFTWFKPQVWHIGIGALMAAVFTIVGSIIIWRRLTPILHIAPQAFHVGTLRNLTSMGGWFLLSQVGALLFLGIDLIVVNKLFGAEAGGRYGAVLQWSSLLRSLAGVMAGVFGPTIFMLYARQDLPGLVRYSQQAVRFIGLTMALPIGIICGFSSPLLAVWLGPDFEPLAPLLSLMTIHLAANLGVLPLFNIRVATKKVRIPGIVTLVMGLMNLGLALLLAGPVGWGIYGVASASAIVLTLGNLIYGPWYAACILGIPGGTFFKSTLPSICTTLGVTMTCWLIARYFPIRSLIGLVLWALAIVNGYALYVYAIAMKSSERVRLLQMIRTAFIPHGIT